MAYSLTILAYKAGNNSEKQTPDLVIEPKWWYMAQLRDLYRFKSHEFDNGYLDYYLDVNKKRFVSIHQNQFQNFEDKSKPNVLDKKALKNIEWLINHFEEFKLVRIKMYEWESGLVD